MPILPYCVLLQQKKISIPVSGVKQSEIQRLQEGELLVLYSDVETDHISASTFKNAALEFHNVVHAIFSQAAVVPFRFPSWLPLPELRAHLHKESINYEGFLRDHADDVQMELRIPFAAEGSLHAATMSGTDHLRRRAGRFRQLGEIAERARKLLSPDVREWREREVPEGLRLYALVRREHVSSVREKLSSRNSEVSLRWSGPWPATEFLQRMTE